MTFSGQLMNQMMRWILGASVCILIGCDIGYSQVEDAVRDRERRSEIRRIGIHYLEFASEYRRSPNHFKELDAFVTSRKNLQSKEQDKTFQLIRDGKFQLIWNAKIELKDQGKFVILGHEPNASKEGGWVLSCNGEVKRISMEEFGKTSMVATSKYPTVTMEFPDGFEWSSFIGSYLDENGSTIKQEFEEEMELADLKDKVRKVISDESSFQILESKDLEINKSKAFFIKAAMVRNSVTLVFLGIRTEGGSYLVRGSCLGRPNSKRLQTIEASILGIKVIE